MGIINVNKKAGAMLDELMKDLSRNDLALLERLPHVRETERYRDVIINTLREFHISLVLVRLVFDDGKIKGYSFLIRGGDGEVGGVAAQQRRGGGLHSGARRRSVHQVPL